MRHTPYIGHIVLLQILLLVLLASHVMADNKNGVSPVAISLPSGPGSVEGLGESFQPMLNTGTAKYSVRIKLPRGVAGHTPELSLQYESGCGDGPLGIGWSFGPKPIRRETERGIPRYVDGLNGKDDDQDGQVDEPDELDRFIGIEGEELIELSDGFYRSRIETRFIRYGRIGEHWEAQLPNGTTLEFGLTEGGRVTDSTGTKIFKWLLEKSTDKNGNVIQYSYASFSGSDNQKYLKEICYGPGPPPWSAFYFAYFTYEDRPDWRKDFRSGFLIKTTKRLKQIDIGIQGVFPAQCAQGDWNNDGIQDALIRRYVLAYENILSFASHLIQVTQFGSDGISYLPPVTFTYTAFLPHETISAQGAIVTSQNAPPTVMDSPLVDLIDLNRDGLPDILKTDSGGGSQVCYYNLGVTIGAATAEVKWSDGRVVTSPDGLAALLHLADDHVYLADMDGNGISDLIEETYSQDVYYFLNQGDGSWSERRKMSIQDVAPPAPSTSDDIGTSDLNFDKRMDVIQSTDQGYKIWFNLEQGKYSHVVNTPGATIEGQTIRFSQTGVQLADINGDRLNDVVRVRPSSVIYCASMGYGSFDRAVTIPIPDAVLTDGSDGQVSRAKLQDINGDGLADLVVEQATSNELWYWLNLGTDEFSSRHIITDMPTQFGPNIVVRWADINGNGTTDLIYADSSSDAKIVALDIGQLVGGSDHPNLLTGIDNGLGVYTEVAYKPSTSFYLKAIEDGNPWSVTLPFPVSVVSQITVSTGLDLDGVPGDDQYIKQYSYRDGFYEDREKAFRGFAQVTVTELGDVTAPTRVTRHRFFTGGPDGEDNDGDGEIDEVSGNFYREEDALKGKLKEISLRSEDGTLYSETINTWLVRNLDISVDNIELRFAYNEETRKLIYEGTQSPQTVRTTYVYDDYGNIIEQREYGALSISGDEAFTFNEYINDTTLWLLGLPSRTYVTDQGLTKFSETISYYDGDDYTGLPYGQATKGNLTRKQGWVQGTTYVNLVRNAYDAFGNIIGMQNTNGYLRTVTYDPTMHTYPTEEAIEVGNGNPDLVITAAYNMGLGVLTMYTDFNNNQTTYGYDSFGRITFIVRPGDSAALPTKAFAYTLEDPRNGLLYSYDSEGLLSLTTGVPPAPSSITTRVREVSGQAGTFDSIQYIDGLGRKLATVEEAESAFVVKDAVLFNSVGKPYRKFLPYFDGSASYNPPPASNAFVEIHYDPADREVLHITPPDANNITSSVSTSYHPLTKTVTDENNKIKTYLYDGRKRLIEVQEHNQGETYNTQYVYNPVGKLIRITDAQNNVKTFEYDGLSRKTAVNDPDRGTMQYTYDDAGNILQTMDNKGQMVTFTYDGANRMLSEDYHDAALISPDITYHYDLPSADYPEAAHVKGKLAWVEDLSGNTFFSYDARGQVAWTVKRIRDGEYVQDFLSAYGYDAMGRLASVTFPDGDRLTYNFNARTLLQSIPGLVDNMDYHASGRLEAISFSNGLKTTYSYDPRARLIGLVTDTAVPSGSPIQDLTYGFDRAINLLTITDNRSGYSGLPQDATQAFQYDDLYRLTRADGPGYGTILFQYDKIGNMTFKASPDAPDPGHIDDILVNLGNMTIGDAAGASNRSLRMPGDPPGPHALTATTSGLSFSYDDNGNMTDNNGDTYEWDFRDRLVRAVTGAGTVEYVYDYTGTRVIKKWQSGASHALTYYINKGYEIKDGKPIKYAFDGKRRLARIEGRFDSQGATSLQTLNLKQGWNLISLHVEPQDSTIDVVLSPILGKFTGIWKYDSTTQQYIGYVPSQNILDLTNLHAQEPYLIYMTSPALLNITGSRAIGDIPLDVGWNLIPCPSDHTAPVEEALQSISGTYESVWGFDASTQAWKSYAPLHSNAVNTLKTLEPGQAYWVKMSEPAQLVYDSLPLRILFYHPDHLGSSTVITDTSGQVVERTEFYPFGLTRFHQSTWFDSAYKFTGKERDVETSLDYFGARYYCPVTCRFISVDPVAAAQMDPRGLHAYAYANNNPLAYVDPTGLSSGDVSDLLDSDTGGSKNKEPGSSWEQLKDDLRKTLLAIGLNALQTALKEAGVGEVAEYVTGSVGLALMGYEAIESGDWEKMLVTGLGIVETGFAAFGHKKLALVEMYQWGKGMYGMAKGAYEAVTSDVGGAAKYAAIKAGMEVYNQGPEGAWNSLINKVKPPEIWGEATGKGPLWEQARGKSREFLNPYLEEGIGYIPLLTEEEKSMTKAGVEGIIY